jgi:diguanylate cyclase (GGDEF)-like protein
VNTITGVLAVLCLSIIVAIVARTITRPLTALAVAARRIRGGRLDAPLPPPTKDEIGQLSHSFSRMTEQLKNVITSLESRTAELQDKNRELAQAETELQNKSRLLSHALEQERENARRDRLTGALNHGAISDVLDEALASSAASGEPFAVAMVDVDGMKSVNDIYGHQSGDALLKAVGAALAQEGAIVGRYGGDEFLVVLPGLERPDTLDYHQRVIEALRDADVSEPATGTVIRIEVSVGFACYPADADKPASLMLIADSAMYAMKRARWPRRAV